MQTKNAFENGEKTSGISTILVREGHAVCIAFGVFSGSAGLHGYFGLACLCFSEIDFMVALSRSLLNKRSDHATL